MFVWQWTCVVSRRLDMHMCAELSKYRGKRPAAEEGAIKVAIIVAGEAADSATWGFSKISSRTRIAASLEDSRIRFVK